jgi:hypothetical protein
MQVIGILLTGAGHGWSVPLYMSLYGLFMCPYAFLCIVNQTYSRTRTSMLLIYVILTGAIIYLAIRSEDDVFMKLVEENSILLTSWGLMWIFPGLLIYKAQEISDQP